MASLLRPALGLLLAAITLSAYPVADSLRQIRAVELDPNTCYRVRDVFFEREDVKLYFTDGYVIFTRPVLGRVVAALFLATDPTDTGEVLVIPPASSERQSLDRFLDESILNEQFRSAMMVFTDDTPQRLLEALAEASSRRLDPQEGQRIASRWSLILRGLLAGSAPRIYLDLQSGLGPSEGFFAAAIRGGKLGRFDVVVDHSLPEQIIAGQLVRSGSRDFYEVWTRFEARSYRSGHRVWPEAPLRLEDYTIEVVLAPDLEMRVRATAQLNTAEATPRALGFELSDRLVVTAVRIGGAEVEFVQEGHARPAGRRGADDSTVVVLLPEDLDPRQDHSLEFEYHGRVVSDAGSGVYFVDNRRSWYPRLGYGSAHYDLRFRYPRGLDVVATGRLVEEGTEGGQRSARFLSGKALRTVAFNVGRFLSASRDVQGFTVDVRANRSVEEALQAPRAPILLPSVPLTGRRRSNPEPPVVLLPAPPPTDPSSDIERVADETAAAFEYFLGLFGEPAMRTTVVSPVPGDFGQGFPGLVYASTRSYFERGDRVLRDLPPGAQRFYADLMRPHEIAHQWWGGVVGSSLDRDGWILEALATYSSLLWLEETRGVAERNLVLEDFRRNLLRREEGATVESAGPIVWGRRLRTSRSPRAYRVIVYEKGAWIVHMLRGVLGDDRFFSMLRAACDRFRDRMITTRGLRELAATFVPAGYHDPELLDFFDQWVHGTGVPQLRAEWVQEPSGNNHRFRLALRQSGVPEYFPVAVPVRVHTLPGRSLLRTVVVGLDDEAGFSVVLRNPASRVEIDPEASLLVHRP